MAHIRFLVVEDDSSVALAHRILVARIAEDGQLLSSFGAVSFAVDVVESARQAEAAIGTWLAQDPEQVVVCLIDQRMPGEYGTQFLDRMRLKWARARLGALLISGYAEDVEVQNAREFGLYRFLSKPVTRTELHGAISQLLRAIFSRVRPEKRPLNSAFVLRRLNSDQELLDYFRLRYDVYGPEGLNVLPPRFHNPAGLEVDRFDKTSIPMGCYQVSGDREVLAACVRLVLRDVQEPYASRMHRLISETGNAILQTEFNEKVSCSFPAEEYYDFVTGDGRYLGIAAPADVAELSRNIVRFDYRGYDLSRFAMEFGIALSRVLGLTYLLAGCDPRHVPMYEKYAYKPVRLERARLRTSSRRMEDDYVFLLDSFSNPSCVLFADLDELPPDTAVHVRAFTPRIERAVITCVCQHTDCYENDYILNETPECPRPT